jgi:hypothetical protein
MTAWHAFYGLVSTRGCNSASRVERKNTGLHTIAACSLGDVKVSLYEREGDDRALVELSQWRGAGVSRGPIAGVALLINQDLSDDRCFHTASMTSAPGSNTQSPQEKYKRGQEDNGAPEEIRTPDPQIRSLVLHQPRDHLLAQGGAAKAPNRARSNPRGKQPESAITITIT